VNEQLYQIFSRGVNILGKLVFGVGINDADYVTQRFEKLKDGRNKKIWTCPFYQKWLSMLTRAYYEKEKQRHPTYRNCTTCEDWLYFSKFRSWMETQDWEDKQLDKDILFPGNKHYSPETCVFVSKTVNSFMIGTDVSRGEYLMGVYFYKQTGKFKAQCNDPFTHKRQALGYFTSEEDAHKAWLAKKLEHAYNLAALQSDERVAKALIGRYENYEEYQP
jgi:hypothetical protein